MGCSQRESILGRVGKVNPPAQEVLVRKAWMRIPFGSRFRFRKSSLPEARRVCQVRHLSLAFLFLKHLLLLESWQGDAGPQYGPSQLPPLVVLATGEAWRRSHGWNQKQSMLSSKDRWHWAHTASEELRVLPTSTLLEFTECYHHTQERTWKVQESQSLTTQWLWLQFQSHHPTAQAAGQRAKRQRPLSTCHFYLICKAHRLLKSTVFFWPFFSSLLGSHIINIPYPVIIPVDSHLFWTLKSFTFLASCASLGLLPVTCPVIEL